METEAQDTVRLAWVAKPGHPRQAPDKTSLNLGLVSDLWLAGQANVRARRIFR